jgi:hypothetical protein
MRTAHIVTREHEVGDRVLALCGKDHKVKQMWEDIPLEAPICRDCVNVIITAADQADEIITLARRSWRRIEVFAETMGNVLNPDDTVILDAISDAAVLFERQQAEKKQAKEDRQRAKHHCLCEWTDIEHFEYNPDCPIHGHGPDDLPPVAPEE